MVRIGPIQVKNIFVGDTPVWRGYYGNELIFWKGLYPAEDLYPKDGLYPEQDPV